MAGEVDLWVGQGDEDQEFWKGHITTEMLQCIKQKCRQLNIETGTRERSKIFRQIWYDQYVECIYTYQTG